MLGATHRLCGVAGGVCASAALLSMGFDSPLVLLSVATVASVKTSTLPDVDLPFSKIPERNLIRVQLHRLVSIMGQGHRSQVTHNLDLTSLYVVVSLYCCLTHRLDFIAELILKFGSEAGVWIGVIGLVSKLVYPLLLGSVFGVASHIISDMFTTKGVWLSFMGIRKIRLVPKSTMFRTGTSRTSWEVIFSFLMVFINIGIIAKYVLTYLIKI